MRIRSRIILGPVALGMATTVAVAWLLGAVPKRLGVRRNELAGWIVPRELAWPTPVPAGWPSKMEWSSVGVTKETRGIHLAFPHEITVWGRGFFHMNAWGTSPRKAEDYSPPEPQYYAERETFGWPWRSLQVVTMETSVEFARTDALKSVYQRGIELRARRDQHDRPPVLPLRPVWMGLIGDSAVYAVAWWLAFNGLGLRRRMREHRGRCGACGYPRGVSDRCTECGAVLTPRPGTPASAGTPAGGGTRP